MQTHETPSNVTVDLIGRVHEFNRIGQTVPPDHTFNADRVGFYTGMQLEELAEKIQAIAGGAATQRERATLQALVDTMTAYGEQFKQGMFMGSVLRADREDLLDADIDVLVVTAGSAQYQTPRFAGAIGHVLDRNDAKFPGGVVTRDANGKIMKPAGWTKPDLSPFVVKPLPY